MMKPLSFASNTGRPSVVFALAGLVISQIFFCEVSAQVLSNGNTVVQSAASTVTTVPPDLGPFKYVPTPRWKEPDPSKVIKRTGAALAIENLYRDGKYAQAGVQGLALLETEKLDDELRLYVANSLGWTNRLKEALILYEGLMQTDFQMDATLGTANILRWQGKEHLSLPLYKAILKVEPDNKDAKEGLRLALREVRPRATLKIGSSSDSSNIEALSIVLNQRWRDETNSSIWEIESANQQLKDTAIRARGSELTVRYRMLETPFKPRFELGADNKNVYGNVGVEFERIPVKLDIGKINWGRQSMNPKALAAGLSAVRLGAQLNLPTKYGALFAQAETNKVSDNNTITTSTVRFTPSWQPLGSKLKFFGGAETRSASFNTLSYWSPSAGYGSGFMGLKGEWGGPDWDINASAQVGTKLFGEAGRSWGVTLTAKRWLGDDVALGVNLWAMSSIRDALRYNVRSIYFTLEKLW